MEYFAYVGGALLGANLIPQIYNTYLLQSAKELSWSFLALNTTGLVCMSIYSFSTNDVPILLPTTVSCGITIVLAIMKLYYQLDSMDPERGEEAICADTEKYDIRYPAMTPES
tara:strand:+ start:1398 stop:1736 length:339 start_codon:yes stop_codon:yes gene_type:complete